MGFIEIGQIVTEEHVPLGIRIGITNLDRMEKAEIFSFH
jgi:hypothetical protein